MAELRPFSSADLTALRWVRVAGDRHEFLLQSGDLSLARLDFAGSIGSTAHAATSNDAWTVESGGFLRPHVSLHRDDGTALARLSVHHLSGGTLTVEGGGSYEFRRAGLLVPAWQFVASDARPVVHIEPVMERGRIAGGLVQVDPATATDATLPVLLIVGWYFIVRAWFEDETIHATTAALSAFG